MAGYIGIYDGLKPGAFSIGANIRYDLLNGGYMGIIDWITGKDNSSRWTTWAIRELMETKNSYQEAKEFLTKVVQKSLSKLPLSYSAKTLLSSGNFTQSNRNLTQSS